MTRKWLTKGEACLCVILIALTLMVVHCILGAWLMTSQRI